MSTVVVLGAGIAGMEAAIALRRKLGPEHRVALLAREDRYVWRPSLPWVAFGLRRAEQIMAPVRAGLERRGIEFAGVNVLRIDPERRQVITDGEPVHYDYLVAGLGAQLDWDAVPGAAEYGQIICRIDGARRMWDAVRRLEKGTAVLGVTSASGCPAPAYESTFLLDDFLRRQGRRRRVDIRFVTVESRLVEISGPAPSRIVEMEFRRRGIEVRLHTGIRRVEPGRVILADDTAIAADFIMLMPPYRGSRAMLDSPGLSDDRGFVRCDLSLRHPRFPEIFAVGDGVALDVAKTGHHAQLQAKVAAQNIASLIAGDVPWAQFRPELFCSLPLGRSRGLLGIWRPSPPSLSNFQLQITYAGRPALWMKVALERYSLWKVR